MLLNDSARAGGNMEGGRIALAGFLHQIFVIGGILAQTEPETERTSQGALSAMLEIVRDGSVTPETYGQDAEVVGLFNGGLQRLLVQVKYSRNPIAYPIEPHELFEITHTLLKSSTLANECKSLPTGFALISNRSLSPDSKKVMEAAENGQPYPKLDEQENAAVLRDSLKRLIHLVVKEAAWSLALREHARHLGVLDSEYARNLNAFIGHVMRESAEMTPSSLNRHDLDRDLAGFPLPYEITRKALSCQMKNEVQSFQKRASIPALLQFRKVATTVSSIGDAPMVIIQGQGGCGKSVVALQVAQQLLNCEDVPPHYVLIDFAVSIAKVWISETIAKWRNAPSSAYEEHPAQALERLQCAHGKCERPVLLMVLDGVDEARDLGQQDRIRQVFQLVASEFETARNRGERTRLVLVASCREAEAVENLWYYPAFKLGSPHLKEVSLDDFSETEFAELVARVSAIAIKNRLLYPNQGPATDGNAEPASALQTIEDGFSLVAPVDAEIRTALHHPLMWGLFTEMADSLQQGILDKEREALNKLCEKYVKRFSEKANLRLGLRQGEARHVLSQVAVSFSDSRRVGLYERDWANPVRSCLFVVPPHQLYEEAVSFGLIRKVSSGKWSWRHPFVCEYLTRCVAP
ncbi:MAG: hypothetical protein ABSA67_11320 [Candidatus Brocadiia bacterium]|jgi:hypothetical protein